LKLLLDEMFSATIARQLRTRGHDVKAVTEHVEWRSLLDAEIMDVARRERRAVVTQNLRDYRPLHFSAITPGGPGHFGLVFLPTRHTRRRKNLGHLVTALERKLAEYPDDDGLANGETWLTGLPKTSSR
jgi:predicted nuclease of predicted toxin-antitoxin system